MFFMALSSASAIAISLINCRRLNSFSLSKNSISVFNLAPLAAASNLMERTDLDLDPCVRALRFDLSE